jgi:hypothetical protein
MLVSDILWSAREDYLDDTVLPYLWKDETLLRHLNTVLNEWCKETGCLRDWTTAAICKTLILANKHTYPMDERITEIHKGYLDHGSPLVLPKDDEWLDVNIPTWRRDVGTVIFLLPDYGKGYFRTIRYPASSLGYWSGALVFNATYQTITHTIGSTETNFSLLLKITDQVVISGTNLNGTSVVPKVFTVASVSTSSFTVNETLADETASAGIIQKVIDTLWLTVSRLPLNQLTIGGVDTESPEIRSDYHPYLIHGICREAWGKQDSQTFDKEKSREQRGLFEGAKRKARAERDWLRYSEKTMKPHPGAL